MIRAPRCPGCDEPPAFTVGPQAFCGTPGQRCRVLSWDVREDPAKFKANAVVVDLEDLATALPPEVKIKPEDA